MSYNILSICKRLLVVAALFVFGVQLALASSAPRVSGSYQVLQDINLGSQSQIRVRIHLVNHGPADLFIQKMTIWDFSHPDKGGMHTCAVTLRAHAFVDTTQEFTIDRPEYQLWQRGLRPRFVLQTAGPGNTRGQAVVRLDRMSVKEAK